MKIKAVIADSDSKTRKILSALISEFVGEIEILGEADNSEHAQHLFETTSPQLIFLEQSIYHDKNNQLNKVLGKDDLEIILLGEQNGWSDDKPCSHHGILAKPIALEDLTEIIDKYKERQKQKVQEQMDAFFVPHHNFNRKQEVKIGIPVVGAWRITKMSNVLYCLTSGRNTEFHLLDGTVYTAIRPLKYFDELISPYGFCRIHESYVVNLNEIIRYNKGRGGSVIMSNDEEINVSRKNKDILMRKLTQSD